MAFQDTIKGLTKEEVQQKAEARIKELGFMRQPTLANISYVKPKENEAGYWVATVSYWGLD